MSKAIEGGRRSEDKEVYAAEPFIRKAEVAKRLGRGVRTVEFWMQQGLLPYYKIGHTVSFKWSEVEGHLKELYHVIPN